MVDSLYYRVWIRIIDNCFRHQPIWSDSKKWSWWFCDSLMWKIMPKSAGQKIKKLVSNMNVLKIWPLLRVQFIIVWMRKVKKPLKLSLCEVFHGIPSLCGLNISKLGVKRFIVRFPNPLTHWIHFFQVRRGPCPSVLQHRISASVSVFQVYKYSVCAPYAHKLNCIANCNLCQ